MKLIIDNSEMVDDFFVNTRCLGIVTPLKNYQFCWNLNYHLGFHFTAAIRDTLNLKKQDRNYHFNLYTYTPNEICQHYLYQNQFEGGYLLPEWKHVDYIWLIRSDVDLDLLTKDVTESLKTISNIMIVIHLPQEKIKNPVHLII